MTGLVANPLKLQAMRELGAEVRLHGCNFDEARYSSKGGRGELNVR